MKRFVMRREGAKGHRPGRAPRANTDVPADEVKKDPARLAKWQADHKEARAKTESGYRRHYTVYEAKGCDHDVLLAARTPTR